ncbi:DUF3422 family protein [Amorphus orientalis]|uniref:Membrane-anchored protein n=1 Tax=Amorphus orientalis TaxID=649198 RepID=A0AAE3VQK9_9HYPH|nr:DUF3422 domain-containing protein [Amorphus orientalis]MDQ0316519.1 putative membrane-anchored protein [Amorphus orientalis]
MNDEADDLSGPFGFEVDPRRAEVIGEIHARPFLLFEAPRTVVHLAFLTSAAAAQRDRDRMSRLCLAQGVSGPGPAARHFVLDYLGGRLRWEQHAEFTTYTFDAPSAAFAEENGLPFGREVAAPGPLISACRVDLRLGSRTDPPPLDGFDPTSLCVSRAMGGAATIVTDFRQDADGLTRIRIVDHELKGAQMGALVQRLLEIETYRTLALLGLPEARRLTPAVSEVEHGLAEVTEAMRSSSGLSGNSRLLDQLSGLAARLEADAAASAFRFGASHAYHDIVHDRLASLREETVEAYSTWAGFLSRRLAPALRTCTSVEERQEKVSTKLTRATQSLRTRVDLELEQINRALLTSMNRRAKMQLRLQQTVEGLSVAAISYYVLGLIGYLADGASEAGLPFDPAIAKAVSVVVVVAVVALLVRRVARRHSDPGGDEDD